MFDCFVFIGISTKILEMKRSIYFLFVLLFMFGELYKLAFTERNICIIIFFSNEHKQQLNRESHSAEFPPEFRLCFIFAKHST